MFVARSLVATPARAISMRAAALAPSKAAAAKPAAKKAVVAAPAAKGGKPLNSYAKFTKENYHRIKATLPEGTSFGDVARAVGAAYQQTKK
ncbi:hypothetical protein CAOG_04334 [Capsaspora owczarzaki ATCC 30864]|uniref:HMG box domain-containing protein n=1 Tax=Capsaspora owczarzaki (strain ATCC 30864) TaxID=595528 RepID=A0A0D2UEM7_CAPO3|nr:hypothetical protein CAOG_04334 [Capsaspora owczarzaki ATCC 30864]KJE93566.1 hypothetical protein CAOG_004334 [Capsaspora owczarzaki ATCC 30864]|eukprot:XP_004348162.1 hypothetical protein CAOG_04334 [Capsaspora owczarzaki ATCC 30864]